MNSKEEDPKKRQALILAGGASHAAYHVGVIRALLEGNVGKNSAAAAAHSGDDKRRGTHSTKVDPDIIAGISAGAFNGAVLLSQLETRKAAVNYLKSAAEYLEDVWLERLAESKRRQGNGVFRFRGDPSEFFNPVGLVLGGPAKPLRRAIDDTASLFREAVRRGRGFQESNERLLKRLTEQVNLSSFVSMKPFEKTIRKSIKFRRLHTSARAFIAGTVGWDDGVLRYFTNRKPDREFLSPTDPNRDGKPVYVVGRISDLGPEIIRASAAVPGIFPRVKLDDEWFCDGAAEVNTPLSCATKFKADVLHVVTSVPPVKGIPARKLPNTFDTLYRFIVMREADAIRDDLAYAENVNNYVTLGAGLQELEQWRREHQGSRESVGDSPMATDADAGVETEFQRQFDRFLNHFGRRDETSRSHSSKEASLDGKAPGRKKLEIHVYRPRESLGGILSLLNFDRKFLSRMIDKGYDDALDHDCGVNGCLLLDPDPLKKTEP